MLTVTKIIKYICLWQFVLTGFFSFAQNDKKQKILELLNAWVEVRDFSGSVLVSEKDSVLLNQGFGFADYEKKIPNTTTTKFCLASVTKQFTATAIMYLCYTGKIHLHSKLSDCLPWYRKDIGDKVTVHQLLTHTSGIPGYTESEGFMLTQTDNQFETKEFIEIFCSNDLEFIPGTKNKYNNSAYYILGAIIEHQTGKTYAEFMKEIIFDKAGMSNSGFDINTATMPAAKGYTRELQVIKEAKKLHGSIAFAAGALYATVEDMYKWHQILYTEKIIPKKWIDTMFYNYSQNFGYGWVVTNMWNKKLIHHTGGIFGYSTQIMRFTDDDICIITLGNTDYCMAFEINQAISAIMFNQPYDIPRIKKSINLDENIIKQYAGEYHLQKNFIIYVSNMGNKLFIQATGQPQFELQAESETDFFLPGYPISITFTKNKKGKVSGLILHQNGDHTAKKIK
jgi:CubicO group peptidase (beta-lactamase class C family)